MTTPAPVDTHLRAAPPTTAPRPPRGLRQHAADRAALPAFHSLVWPVWLIAGLVAVTHNPLLNLLVIAQATLVALVCHSDGPIGRSFGLFVWLGLAVLLLRALLAAVPIGGLSYGATPLLRLPSIALPIWLGGLQLGGTVTLEMIIQGAVGGLRLWALLLVFGAFNAAADHYRLLRRVPAWLLHAGLATTIALTFVPHLVTQAQAIRDAQRVRGHRFRSWRDAIPLLTPLLAGSLERSLQLAEAMDSRGYGRVTGQRPGLVAHLLLIAGLSLLSSGLYAVFTATPSGGLLILIGGLLTLLALRRFGARPARSRYLRERWRTRDTLSVLACLVLIGGMVGLRLSTTGGLFYSALPRTTWPPFEPAAGALLMLLSTPALMRLYQAENKHGRHLQPPSLAGRNQ